MKLILLGFATGLLAAPPACGDVLLLTDGRMLLGEIIEQNDKEVVFRHEVGTIWSNMKYKRRDIQTLESEPGDQSDRKGVAPEPAPSAESPLATSAGPLVLVIPCHGQVGGIADKGESIFDAAVLEECFVEAHERGAELVVLDIHSPGGLVAEMEATCETIIAWHNRLRIAAYTRDAYSAAAVISLTCRELVVHPESKIGAATIIVAGGASDPTALDAKLASPHYAKQRDYMRASGRPYEVVQAMTIKETELWWDPQAGFRTSKPEAAGAWKHADGKTTILTMTAADAVKWRLAKATAPSASAAARKLGFSADAHIERMDEAVQQYNRKLSKRLEQLTSGFDNYFDALGTMVAAMNRYVEAANRNDRITGESAKTVIRQSQNKASAAQRSIRKADKLLLARIDVPDEIVRRLEDDAALLGRVSRLVESDTADGFNEAAQRVNQVLASWRALFAGMR